MSAGMAQVSPLPTVSDVEIDSDGTFKYILIELNWKGANGVADSRTIVRGYGWAQYHADILDRMTAKFCALDVEYECLGGGRIEHQPGKKEIKVYGYSVGFGQADHTVTVKLLQKKYPDYTITHSNEGY